MGRKIRADLVGVTHVHRPDADPVVLSAGDEVPDGLDVGGHLIEGGDRAEPTIKPADPVVLSAGDVAKPRGNAGRDAWAKYATWKSVPFEEDATRDDIKAAVEASEG